MTTEKTTFTDLGLCKPLLDALTQVGYEHPTPIQEQAIPYVLMGRDVIGIAQTGTGKTASFTLPLLEILQKGRAKARMPRALILAPTRELAAQIQDNLKQYSQNMAITSTLLVGGESMNEQTAQIQRGVDVVIATPGRLMDHFQRGGIIMTEAKFFVIDEADRMLDMGFIPDIEKIGATLPALRQTLMFTATMPPEIRKLAAKFLSNPKEISVARASSTSTNVTQNIYRSNKERKADDLLDLIDHLKPSSTLIFCNRKTDVDKIKRLMHKNHIKAEAIHGDMPQSQRYASLDRFKSGESRFIVCSDIAARGIDIDDVTHVFNFDVPFNAEDYVHRIGRTGRAGKSGAAFTLTTSEDDKNLAAIIALIQMDIPEYPSLRQKKVEKPVAAPVEKTAEKKVPAERKTPQQRKPLEPKKQPAEQKKRPEAVKSAPAVTENSSEPLATHEKINLRPSDKNKKPAPRSSADDNDSSVVGFGDDLPSFMRERM